MPIDRTARHFIYLTSQARVVIIIIYWAPTVCQKLWLKSPFGFYYQQHFTYLVNKIQRGKYLCWCHTDGYLVSSVFDIFLDLKHLILETFLVVQLLRLCTSTAWGVGSVLSHETKILHKPCGVAKTNKQTNIILKELIFCLSISNFLSFFSSFSCSLPIYLSQFTRHCSYICYINITKATSSFAKVFVWYGTDSELKIVNYKQWLKVFL